MEAIPAVCTGAEATGGFAAGTGWVAGTDCWTEAACVATGEGTAAGVGLAGAGTHGLLGIEQTMVAALATVQQQKLSALDI